jgi:hypothetical protein
MRQHGGRLTGADWEFEQAAESFTRVKPTAEHFFIPNARSGRSQQS